MNENTYEKVLALAFTLTQEQLAGVARKLAAKYPDTFLELNGDNIISHQMLKDVYVGLRDENGRILNPRRSGQHNKITAIRYYRAVTGSDLRTAKNTVETMLGLD